MTASPDEKPEPKQKSYFPDVATRSTAAARLGKTMMDALGGPARAHPEKKLKDWIVFFAPAYFTIAAMLAAYAIGVLDVFVMASWMVYGFVALVLATFIQESRPESFSYFGRSVYHALAGVIIVSAGMLRILQFQNIILFVSFLFVAFFGGYVLELLGVETVFSKSHILRHTPTFSKSSHYEAGTFWLLSCLIVLTLFDALIAYAAILVLALGDSAASFVGKTVGRTPNPLNPRKTIEGTLAFFAVSLFVMMPIVPTSTAFFTAIVVAIVEALPLKINDNLVIPLSAAVSMTLLSML
jgi:dolichol kinase